MSYNIIINILSFRCQSAKFCGGVTEPYGPCVSETKNKDIYAVDVANFRGCKEEPEPQVNIVNNCIPKVPTAQRWNQLYSV